MFLRECKKITFIQNDVNHCPLQLYLSYPCTSTGRYLVCNMRNGPPINMARREYPSYLCIHMNSDIALMCFKSCIWIYVLHAWFLQLSYDIALFLTLIYGALLQILSPTLHTVSWYYYYGHAFINFEMTILVFCINTVDFYDIPVFVLYMIFEDQFIHLKHTDFMISQ